MESFLLQFISVLFFFFLCIDIIQMIVLQLLSVVLNLCVIKITMLRPMYYTKHRFSLITLFASLSSFFPLTSITLKTLDKTCSILEIDLCSLNAFGSKKIVQWMEKSCSCEFDCVKACKKWIWIWLCYNVS